MTIKIDKNIPFQKNNQKVKYPFEGMGIGDSFFVAQAKSSTLMSASMNWRKNGEKYASRTVTENGVHGCRIWRIA